MYISLNLVSDQPNHRDFSHPLMFCDRGFDLGGMHVDTATNDEVGGAS